MFTPANRAKMGRNVKWRLNTRRRSLRREQIFWKLFSSFHSWEEGGKYKTRCITSTFPFPHGVLEQFLGLKWEIEQFIGFK